MSQPAPEGLRPSVGSVLERDHERIDGHLARFGRGLSTGTIDIDAFRAGSTGLRHHIYVEEEHHFPALRASGLLAPILVMLREHGQIWDLLDTLEAGLGDATTVATLAETWSELDRVLADHNMKEERIIYPAGDRVLPADVVEDILASLSSGVTPRGWVCEMAGR